MTAPERIYPMTWVTVQNGVVTQHMRPMSVSSIWSEAFGEGCVAWEDYATLAAKCEALERELSAKSRPLDPRMKAAIQEGYNAEAVALEKQVSDTLAARVRSLEEALRRVRDEGGEVEGFQLEFGIRGIAKMRDSARYVTEADMKRIVNIARAALSDTPREEGKT